MFVSLGGHLPDRSWPEGATLPVHIEKNHRIGWFHRGICVVGEHGQTRWINVSIYIISHIYINICYTFNWTYVNYTIYYTHVLYYAYNYIYILLCTQRFILFQMVFSVASIGLWQSMIASRGSQRLPAHWTSKWRFHELFEEPNITNVVNPGP